MTLTRRDFLIGGVAAAALQREPDLSFAAGAVSRYVLWYRGEAKRWLEALPIGNGRIGGMVFGGPRRERIALTEATVWSGAPSASDINPGGREHLGQIRQLLFQGDYAQARQLCERHLLSHPANFGTNLPLLHLSLEFDQPEEIAQYRRTLDLDQGIAHVAYEAGGHLHARELFSSNPDDVLVVHV